MYTNALVAIDLAQAPARQTLEQARDLVGADAHIHVLHVIELQFLHYSVDPTFTGSLIRSFETDARLAAARRLAEFCQPFGIADGNQHVVLGHVASEIHKFVETNQCDVIVMGTHGWRGWQRLLGSTTNAVLHGTPVDVYLCRIAGD